MKDSLVYHKAFKFAIRIVNLYKHLCKEKNEYIISKQLLRSGTSIGANIKEASETSYWLELLKSTDYMNAKALESVIGDCTELNTILASIVKTTKEKLSEVN